MSTLKINRLEKKVKKLEQQLEREAMIKEIEFERLNTHWAEKFDMIVGIFEIQAREAGTISELRKWFSEWTKDVNSIDQTAENAGEAMDEIIKKHGFEFKIRTLDVPHREILGAK